MRIHLLRFTNFDAPKAEILALGGEFKPMGLLRGSAMSELLLLREVFNLIVGAGGGCSRGPQPGQIARRGKTGGG